MSNHGIDYGMGQANVDRETGIRYGVIPVHALSEWAHEEFEGDYGEPMCGQCGNAAVEYSEDTHGEYAPGRTWGSGGCADWACEGCEVWFPSEDAYSEEALGWTLDDGEYTASMNGHYDSDIFITRSPYYTHAQYCSPCAPGACHLLYPTDESGPRCYCFGPDWFGSERPCHYPVWSVATGKLVYSPGEVTGDGQ